MEANKTGFTTGDIFWMNDNEEYAMPYVYFYQVIELIQSLTGTVKVKVVEIIPEITEEYMDYSDGELKGRYIKVSAKRICYPHKEDSFYIDDNEDGDLKRVCFEGDVPAIKINGYYAHLYHGQQVYESLR